ncbi:hypothetical protein PVK06_002510 [Gossypium arboreum]|uniref:Uncharacterized protein n=1 Tax=Gossypium arboreum TaxID=29729 RepID=A0ABR0R3U5_GOSAR|nr:hypothetical protein PVK06_002510 [Gossypium arboreum]
MKECPKVREVLIIRGLNNRLLDSSYDRCIDWLEDTLCELDSKAVVDFFTLFWNCWNNKNKMVNVDAAILDGCVGYRVIVRDANDFVLGGCYGFAYKTLNVIWEELEALSMGFEAGQNNENIQANNGV